MATAVTGVEQLAINTIRTLAMDAVQQANSGHPGTPMALAPVAYALWSDQLRYDPLHPIWPARDRFVLSCGHASMLLYALLHLSGVRQVDPSGEPRAELGISLDDIRNFRQLHSPCAGHPEYGSAPGIETTTGPLGQGVGNSVGMALAARWLAARYDRPGFELFGYDVYCLCSDGDLMEGIGCEAASLAGHLRLGNLCWIYDDNRITIEGSTDLAFTEDVAGRFEALGWNVIKVADANDLAVLRAAFGEFARTGDRPTLIIVRSIIGFGAPNKQNSHAAHGSPLGESEVQLAKAAYGWPTDQTFLVPEEVRQHFAEVVIGRGGRMYQDWFDRLAEYQYKFPELAAELELIWQGSLPAGWAKQIPEFPAGKAVATRTASGKVLNAIAGQLPWLLGGSADLAPSNNTLLEGFGDIDAGSFDARNLHFGVREHAMGTVCNGLALSGLRPYAGTFFVFTDYLRPALRLSSIMHLPVVYVLTHDSIGLGEDGPTHQPIEHLAACRAIPGLTVFRPCDANEVAAAYRAALPRRRPLALILTRQNVATLDRQRFAPAQLAERGGYILWDSDPSPQVILIGTGSEVQLCVEAAEQLDRERIRTRVVSLPSWELFEMQAESYRQQVLPAEITARVAVEAGVRQGWDRYLGPSGEFVGLQSFGASAPYEKLYAHFGLTVPAIVAAAKRQL
jgi:transketolase